MYEATARSSTKAAIAAARCSRAQMFVYLFRWFRKPRTDSNAEKIACAAHS